MKSLTVGIICILISLSLILVFPDKENKMKVIPQEFLVITNPEVGLGLFRALDLEGNELFYEDTICIYGMGDTISINSGKLRKL